MAKRTGKPNGPIYPWKAKQQAGRRKFAEERQAAYDKLTPQQKLDRLDKGNFKATKERTKIQRVIDESNRARTNERNSDK
jgi:hypothetical protein